MSDPINHSIALFYVGLFLLATVHKFRALDYYAELIHRFVPTLPDSKAVAALIAGIEAGLVLLLLLPQTRIAGLTGGMILLLIYAGLMSSQIMQGKTSFRCACSGPSSELTISSTLITRNLICAALGAAALLCSTEIAASAFVTGLAVVSAGFMFLLYLCIEQLIGNAKQMDGEIL